VVFDHGFHVDADAPDCSVCHRGGMPILASADGTPRLMGEALHEPRACGACHDGEEAFSVDEDCEFCHLEE
jgi:c(7)-type cytochrome triheme protein